ncbi:hypothetical protein AB0L85_15375 [Streptomyces sp. NPDC052051]|uniref:hypothetical protein n=1 Tax=Streptomyces sp. NPDC052051 TaxID=3154649 RepID=UPI00341703D8
MGGGSAKPKRRRAAGSGLRYVHRSGKPSADPPRTRLSGREATFGCLTIPAFLALLAPVIVIDMHWGRTIWGSLAPAWPGGAYAFAATVGALVPLVLVAFAAPLVLLNWKMSKARSLAWVAASLPGLTACWLVAGVIGSTWRPKRHTGWNASCYRTGGACWVHEQLPYIGAVGLTTTVAVTALLVTAFLHTIRRRQPPEGERQ